jgi:hypothetical protein
MSELKMSLQENQKKHKPLSRSLDPLTAALHKVRERRPVGEEMFIEELVR